MHVNPCRKPNGNKAASRRPVRFEALDSWRGVAAILVVLFHAQIASHVQGWDLVRAGESLVDFFFVLSGFVIAHAYRDRLDRSESLARFLVARLGRLYPLHLFMFALFFVFELGKADVPGLTNPADPAFSGSNAPWTIVSNLLLLHSLRFDDVLSWNTPSWSISAEWICYILFGLAVVAWRRRLATILAATVLAAPLVVFVLAPAGMETTTDLGAIRALYSFAAGALLFCIAGERILETHGMKRRERARRLSVRNWTLLEIAIVLLAAWTIVHARETGYAYLTPLVFCGQVAIFSVEHGIVSRLMKLRPWVFLGAISYSIYMTHMFVQLRTTNLARLCDRLFDTHSVVQVDGSARYGVGIDPGNLYAGDLLVALMVLVTVSVSIVTWRWIEQPGIALARGLARRMPDATLETKKGPREAALFDRLS